MSKEIYNEGRVVGYSAYELYVKTALANGADVVATEQEWLASSIAMGSSMLVKIPNHTSTDQFIDIPFPSETLLSAANTIVATFFDGSAEYENNWATKITDYGKGIKNSGSGSPSGYLNAGDVPHKDAVQGEPPIDTTYRQFQDYLRITDGMIIQAGTWTPTGGTPASDLTEVQIGTEGSKSPVPILRLYFDYSGSITTQPQILLTGFTDRNVLVGVSGVIGGSTNTETNHYKNGGFLGPSVFPWGSKITFIIPSNYMNKLTAVKLHVASSPNYTYPKIDVYNDLDAVYATSSQLYAQYTSSTPSSPAGVQFTYDYILSPSQKTSLINVYTPNENVYPPAMYVGVPDKLNTGSQQNIRQYPVDVVAPGTVKMFKNSNNTMMKSYESTFVGTTALNITQNGILSIAGSSGLYSLNNIVAGNGAVTVTRESSGAWSISVDATGQMNVVTDSNTSSIKITPSTSSGVKTFTVSQTIQKKPQTTGIEVTSSNGVVNLENTMKLKSGVGIDISKNGDEYTITNSRPVLSSSDYTNTPYTGYRVWYPLRAKQLLDPNNTYQAINGYYTGVVRRIDYSGYGWKDYILYGTNGDTAHREKLGMSYTVSMSNDTPISGVLQVSESVSVDAGDTTVVPSAYSSTTTYNTLNYCSYTDAKSNVRKFRCIRNDTVDKPPLLSNGNVNAGYWREVTAVVTAYDTSKTYYRGDYVIVNSGQYVCISSTPVTGAWQGSDWKLDNATILPSITYGLCIADAISSGLGSSEIPAGSSLFYTHGRSYNEEGTDTIDGVTYTYYKWDHGIIARFGITPAMCKKMFFGDEDYTFQSSSRVLIDAPTSGSSGNIINWRAYVGNSSSSALNSDKMRLSYSTGYRLICRYPFIVDSGNIKMATFDNINDVNRGWLIENFSSAVGYDLTRDTQGGALSTTNDPYKNFSMIFDLVAETISDGFNNQLRDPIIYEGHPTTPYLIASDNAHMSVSINLRMNNVSV